MRGIALFFGAFFGIASLSSLGNALADPAATSGPRDGVLISVRPLPDQVLFCIDADADHKISAEFGVEFKLIRGDKRLWREEFPKLITGPSQYFELPILVSLQASSRRVAGHSLHVVLGACSFVTFTCDLINRIVRVPDSNSHVEVNGCGG
jgi:hypothetical protein